jgi:chromosome segregation ATPase
VRRQWVVYLATAMLAGAAGGALLAPAPVGAVAREIVELQQGVQQLLQTQKDLQTAIAQQSAVQKTLMELSLDSVGKLSGTMSTVQKSVQEVQANSGARLDTMSTQMQGVSDSLQEMQARMGKLNQQLTDAQNSIQAIDAKLDCSVPVPVGSPGVKSPKP